MPEQSDKELIDQYRNGDNPHYAFNLLVKKYKERVYWHIRRIVISHEDTDDLVQDTFVKVWRNLVKFRGESMLFTWIYRIATNEAISFLKKKRRKFLLPMVNIEDQISTKLHADVYFDGDEAQLRFQQAILQLPDKQRLVFNMRYFDGLKYEEMSEVLNTSVGALKASYHHAVRKIETYLKDN